MTFCLNINKQKVLGLKAAKNQNPSIKICVHYKRDELKITQAQRWKVQTKPSLNISNSLHNRADLLWLKKRLNGEEKDKRMSSNSLFIMLEIKNP